MIQKQICLIGVGCFVFLVSLACLSVTRLEEASPQDVLNLASLEIDQEMVWKHTYLNHAALVSLLIKFLGYERYGV